MTHRRMVTHSSSTKLDTIRNSIEKKFFQRSSPNLTVFISTWSLLSCLCLDCHYPISSFIFQNQTLWKYAGYPHCDSDSVIY